MNDLIKEDIEKSWEKVQDKIQDDVEDGFEDISKILGSENTDSIAAFYFLMFWTRVMIRYGKNGEKHDNKQLIDLLTKMMNGNLPQDKENIFDRRVNN
jgi:hypothetical protein